ncbi:MAG: hypothetical protein HZC54_05050 [Verrucomicrobia bacterium]|nr:hypothetical protein [Verrucomicrobiota bacterium]
MKNDPIVAEVRKAREKLAARFDFDLDAMFKDTRKRQAGATRGTTLPKSRHLRPA